MICNAFAKINLTLDITGKREDGYHTIDSVMQAVSLCDTVELHRSAAPGVRLSSDQERLPVNEKNTAYQAAALFLEHCGFSQAGVELRLHKVIPSRAGLGGGSADAAAVLRGLDALFETRLSPQELLRLAARVGADVPFCLVGGAARCTGIGEQVEPITPLPAETCILLCKPPAGVSTPRAYAQLDQNGYSRSPATPRMLAALENGDLRQIGRCLSNPFDEAMKLMQVRQIRKAMLSAGACGAMMSGSGSAVYGLFEKEENARCCMMLLEERGQCFLCRPAAHF